MTAVLPELQALPAGLVLDGELGELSARYRSSHRSAAFSYYGELVQRVVGVEPIFVVSDVPRAVAHYEQLGFSTSHHDEGYAFAHRDKLTIHLAGPGV